MASNKNQNKAYLLLILNAALWGFSVPIIKYSLNFTNSSTFLFYRFLIASISFIPVFWYFKKHHRHHPSNLLLLIALALLGTPLTLYPLFVGLHYTSSIEASIIESSSPIFTVLASLLFLKEKVKPKETLGLIIAILGTSLLLVEPLLRFAPSSQNLFGNFLIILSNVFWTAFLLISKRTKTNPIDLTLISFLVSVPFFFFVERSQPNAFNLNLSALPGIIYMAICGSIIAFWAYQEGQKYIQPGKASIISYLKPVFTIPLAILWLKEPLSPTTVISSILIVAGVLVSEKK